MKDMFPVDGSIRWAYAINAWKPGFMGFARQEEHERAFKATAASGFGAVELKAGSGRWEALGRPDNIAGSYGSVAGFAAQVKAWGISKVSSFFYDPGQMSFEDLHFGLDPLNPAHWDGIAAAARPLAQCVAELGGSCLVVRPVGSFGKVGALSAEQLATLGRCWSQVGGAIRDSGVSVALHFDALSAARTVDDYEAVLATLDPTVGGLALDTAELTIAGHDVAALYRHLHARVVHLHLKDALDRDTLGEYTAPNAERSLIQAGGSRRVARWFSEMGTPQGLVDFPALVDALRYRRYRGWIVVESDGGPAPVAAGVMSNGWYVRHVLAPRLAAPLP